MTHATLPHLITTATTLANETRATFSAFTPGQLNWKPAPEKWSVGQCLDHLLTTNGEYFPIFDSILAGTKKSTLWEKVPGLPGLWGKMLIKSVSPDSVRKLKAPQIFQPTSSGVDAGIVQRFLDQQGEIIRTMEASRSLDAARIILTSPVAGFITYSLLDAYRILVTHEQRHLLQAKRVMETSGFGGGPQ